MTTAPSITLVRREIGVIGDVPGAALAHLGNRPPSRIGRFSLGADRTFAGFLIVEATLLPSPPEVMPDLEIIVRSDNQESMSMPLVATLNLRGGQGRVVATELVKLRKYVSIACWPVRPCAGWTGVRASIEHAP